VRRLFFIIMVGLWGAFIALAFTSPETLDEIWRWTGDLGWPLQVVGWVLFLPWMIGLWVWQADWSFAARVAVIAVLALGWSAASFPRK
jgi:hypothetical protein